MDRSIILVGRSMAPTKYVFKVPQVGRFLPCIGDIGRLVESPLYPATNLYNLLADFRFHSVLSPFGMTL